MDRCTFDNPNEEVTVHRTKRTPKLPSFVVDPGTISGCIHPSLDTLPARVTDALHALYPHASTPLNGYLTLAAMEMLGGSSLYLFHLLQGQPVGTIPLSAVWACQSRSAKQAERLASKVREGHQLSSQSAKNLRRRAGAIVSARSRRCPRWRFILSYADIANDANTDAAGEALAMAIMVRTGLMRRSTALRLARQSTNTHLARLLTSR